MEKGIVCYSGVSESRSVPVISGLIEEEGQSLIITAGTARAERLASDLSFFTDREIIVMPGEERFFLRYDARDHEKLAGRLRALKALRTDENAVVVAPALAALKKMLPPETFQAATCRIKCGEEISPDQLRKALVYMGYEPVELVESPGQFSVRGGITDIFPPDSDTPYRVEFFGDEVDSIRSFDPENQRSKEGVSSLTVFPAEQLVIDGNMFSAGAEKLKAAYNRQIKRLSKSRGNQDAAENLKKRLDELCEYIESASNIQLLENYISYFTDRPSCLWDYMLSGRLIIDDPDRIYEHVDALNKELSADFDVLLGRGDVVPEDAGLIPDKEDLIRAYSSRDTALIMPFPKSVKGGENPAAVYSIQSRQIPSFNGRLDIFASELKSYVRNGYRTTIVASGKERLESIREYLDRENIRENIFFKEGFLSAGMDFPEEKICYISDNDIFPGHRTVRRKRTKSRGSAISSFSDMRKGDFVVHENHGIGKFLGIEQLTVQGEKKDYIKIKYAGEDLLYVPVEQMDIVQKYIGAEGITPKVNRLSGSDWKAAKARAKAAIAEMAEDLVNLYAKREMEAGYAFEKDTPWQREFEESFPYTETGDQMKAVEEIKTDMEKPTPMDRLLCGDVGFGKTEVAARALFKCVGEGRQAAILVPTTILANQHYYTLKERFEKFPFKVEMMSRFKSKKQQEQIADKVAKGQIDLLIGTHRILSDDVKFKDLGLLVIDEEQRFGVAHKEVIKKLRSNIDVLTLSATPIPRTLNMSLTGIKDMSIIEEPPEDRYPVQTYVLEQDDSVIREIINRELDRGGQAFVVYNRVRGISRIAEKIASLVPEARVAVGHGQMSEHALEDIMLKFVGGEYDVLVATTIIESGIDISNANTMIILDADKFGLSQLYQLRGRVGRFNRMGYAYLMYQRDKVLTEVAEKRLKVIREFTEFGAGFKIAMRDLEIRGAGNLLGSEQSGHMMNIGYELYCKLVDDAMRRLRGEIVNENREEVSVELKAAANIPDRYVDNEMLKLQMYKKIAAISSQSDMEDMIDELLDRFGELPGETLNLVKISRIRALAEELSVTRIHEQSGKVMVLLNEKNPVGPFAISQAYGRFGMKLLMHAGREPYLRLNTEPREKLDDLIELLQILFDNREKPGAAENSAAQN